MPRKLNEEMRAFEHPLTTRDSGNSPIPQIVSQEAPPDPSRIDQSSLDDATLAAINQAQNEHGTRIRASKKGKDEMEVHPVSPSPISTPAPSKKRPAKGKSMPAGVKKPLPKKRKVDKPDEQRRRTSQNRSMTPSSLNSKLSLAGAAQKSSKSATPRSSSPHVALESDDAGSDRDSDIDDTLYCICRKPDNHTWMIGCDGGCEDWFHGKCVDMQQADEDLVDKYICPNCQAKGNVVTTWKPMCRRGGCRKPARLKRGAESKYCSDACGVAFMRGKLASADEGGILQKETKTDTSMTDNSGEEDFDIGPLGGPIRPFEVKGLVDAVTNVSEFRRLGSADLLTPPPSASPEGDQSAKDVSPTLGDVVSREETRLAEIAARKGALRERRALLKDRERFVVMAKERAQKTAAKPKIKDQCGYDDRLSWDEMTLADWLKSGEGKDRFTRGTLDSADEEDDGKRVPVDGGADDHENVALKPRPQPATNQDNGAFQHLCSKRRCTRHTNWQKLALQDVRFEEAEVGNEMRRIDGEERELRESALIKARIHGTGLSGAAGTTEVIED